MGELITFVLYALATARLTRLVKDDELLRAFRRWWVEPFGGDSLARYWIRCVWCISVAAAAAPAAAYVLVPDHPVPRTLAAILAFSWLTVLAFDVQKVLYGKAVMYTPQPDPDPQEAER